MSILDKIKKESIIAVIRKADQENIVQIVEALHKGGIKTIEITAETPKVTVLIEKVVERFGREVMVGAGTVLDSETANLAIKAGAEFVVSPTLNIETIKLTNRYGIFNICGALTPTEILTAYEHGADMIKIFPADIFGPNYVKSIHGPLSHIPVVVTGGITLDNMNKYLEQGSIAVGMGSNLVNVNNLNTAEDYKELTERSAQFVRRLRK